MFVDVTAHAVASPAAEDQHSASHSPQVPPLAGIQPQRQGHQSSAPFGTPSSGHQSGSHGQAHDEGGPSSRPPQSEHPPLLAGLRAPAGYPQAQGPPGPPASPEPAPQEDAVAGQVVGEGGAASGRSNLRGLRPQLRNGSAGSPFGTPRV